MAENIDLKQLANAIKILSATSDEMSKRSRDLITILVAMQRGLIQEQENIQKLFEDIASGKFSEGNFKKQYSEIVSKQKNALTEILGIRDEVYKMDAKHISQLETENDIINFSVDLFRKKYSISKDISSLYDTIIEQLDEERGFLEENEIYLENQTDYLQQQIQARGALTKMLQNTLIKESEVERTLEHIKSVIDSVSGEEFVINGVGTFDRTNVVSELDRLAKDTSSIINSELDVMGKQIEALVAKERNVVINVATGDVMDADTSKKLSSDAAKAMKAEISSTAVEYQKLVSLMATGKTLTEDQVALLPDATRIILKSLAAKKKELEAWKESMSSGVQSAAVALAKDQSGIVTEIAETYDKIGEQLKIHNKFIRDNNLQVSEAANHLREQMKSSQILASLKSNEIIDDDKLKASLGSVKTAIDDIDGIEFEVNGIIVNRDQMVAEVGRMARESVQMIDAEAQYLDKQLQAIAARSMNMEVNFSTGEIIDIKENKVLDPETAKRVNGEIESLYGNYEKLVDQMAMGIPLTAEQNSNLDQATRLIIEAVAAKKADLNNWKQGLVVAEQNLSVLSEYATHLRAAKLAGDGVANAFGDVFNVLPDGLQKMIGVHDISERIGRVNNEAIDTFKRTLLETGSPAKAITTALGSWGKGIGGAIGPLTAYAGIILGVFKLTNAIDDQWKELGHKLGVSTVKAKEIYKANLDLVASTKNQHLTLSEIEDVQAAYMAATGKTADLTSKSNQQLMLDLGEISKVMGYNVDTAVGLHHAFVKMGADDALAKKLQTELGFMTKMSGISAGIVSKDMVDAAEEVAIYFAGMPEKAARTALQVRRMGMSLKQATGVANQMLNLEGFMTDMYELAAMGGPDLSGAFEFGIRGDIEGMTKEIMNAVGSVEEFGKMDYLQRKKLASTIGMSADELSHSLMMREKLADLSEKDAKFVERNLDQFGNIADMDQQAVRDRLDQVQATERLDVAWSKIKAVFIKAIIPLVETFESVLANSEPLLNALVGTFKILGGAVQFVGWVIGGMLKPLKWLGQFAQFISDIISSWIGPLDSGESKVTKMGTAFKFVTDQAQNLIGVLTVAFLGRGIFTKFIPALKSAGGLLGGIKNMAGSILSKVGDGGILGKIVGKSPATDVVKKVGGGKLGGVVETITGSGDTKNVGKLGDLTDKLSGGVSKLGNLVSSGFKKVGEVFKSIMTSIAEGLEKFGKNALKGAATMVVLAGALWITSKALQNFAGLEWETLAKGGVALVGLAGIALILGKATTHMITGAAAIAVLGLALVPLAYALNMMADVEWSTLAMAGVALVGLAGAAAVLGSVMMTGLGAAVILAGAAAIAVLGAALLPLAFALKLIGDSNLGGIGDGLKGLASGLLEFSSVELNPTAMMPLLMIASISQPLDIAAKAVGMLGESISKLSQTLQDADLSKLSDLEKLSGIVANVGIGYKISGENGQQSIQPPSAIATAQNVSVAPPSSTATAQNVSVTPTTPTTQSGGESMNPVQQAVEDARANSGSKKVEMLLTQLIHEIQMMNSRPIVIDFGDGVVKELNRRTKGLNGNR